MSGLRHGVLAWKQEAVFHQVHSRGLPDGDGDGVGDIKLILFSAERAYAVDLSGPEIAPFWIHVTA